MTSKEELKTLIMTFRIAELQSLLESAGDRNLKLRKKELQKKALKLLSKKKIHVFSRKIHAIYAKMNDNRGDYTSSYNFDNWFDEFVYNQNQRLPDLSCNSYYGEYNPSNDSKFCNNSSDSTSINSLFMSTFKHLDMQRVNDIKFKDLSFFEYVSDIVKIQPLIPRRQDDDIFDFHSSFTLNSETRNNLSRSEDKKSRYQVLLRMCILNNEMEVTDTVPPKLSVTVNNKYCSLPPPPPTNKTQSSSSKRIDEPINITSFIEKNSNNKLEINWSANYCTLFGFVIQFVRKYDPEELIKKLKEKGEQNPAISKKLIFNNLNDEDVEIAATSLKMSLTCPLGKMLMSLPTRGSTCNHLQCFDGCFYIKMNEIRSTWQCPVCNETCLYEDLFIDGYFMDILRSDKFTPSVSDIQLNADGSWESVRPADRSQQSARSPSKNPNKRPKIVEEESNEPVEIISEPNNELPRLLNESIVDDLKRFFFQYDNPGISDISTHNSSFSSFPNYDDCSLDNFYNIKPMNDTELSTLSSNSSHNSAPKNNVILVDLTESDSESDEIKSISSFSGDSSDSSLVCVRNDLHHDSPPVYDIDSDSS